MLETKLYVPRRRRGLVPRERLRERLDHGAESALTLVCAPPGFGKTTMVSQWLAAWAAAEGTRRVAWVSLDQGDNHPPSFWGYVVTALQRVVPTLEGRAADLLDAAQPAPIEVVLTGVLNDLARAEGDVVLVLDDYHVIETAEIHTGMVFLLDHLPPQLHLVIASRSDPPFPLARLRARGELTEARAADLRFTTGECAAYLNGEMGLELSPREVATLDERTEGWVAALQLAALSMQGRSDIPDFIAGFAGDDRYIVDYLAQEVLQRQSVRIQDFLLQTSILPRLTGPLCDAVTEGPGDGRAMLEELERANLFLVPLDDRRRWYRYHHLFEDVLHARLLDERPEEVPELHRRASGWFEQNGEPVEAVDHALLAADVERAADLIELTARAMHKDRRESVVRAWLDALPPDLFDTRPVLCISFAAALMASGEYARVESYLVKAERWFGPDAPAAGMVVANQEEFDRGPASLALYRAGQALLTGDGPGTVHHAQQVLDLVPHDDHAPRGAANGLLGLAAWSAGDLEGGHQAYGRCMAHLLQAGQVADTLGVSIAMGDIRITQGRLDDALRTYEQALATAAATARPVLLRGTADMHVAMSEIHRERGDLAAARAQVQASHDLGEFNGLPQNAYRSRVAEAGICEAEGDVDGGLRLLDEAERVYVGDFSPQVRPVAAVRARLLARHGRVAEALRWASEGGLGPDDDLSYQAEFAHITLARVLLASASPSDRGPAQAGLALLQRLRAAAEAGGRAGNMLEILIVQALAQQALGDAAASLRSLAAALEQGEAEGYVRIFADDGQPMGDLLTSAARQRIRPGYVRRLLLAIGDGAEPAPARTGEPEHLIDPLSDRELHVLRLLGTDLSGPEIARELTVSLNTVRTHTKSIYAKLGVGTRRAAVTRAAGLGLLGHHR